MLDTITVKRTGNRPDWAFTRDRLGRYMHETSRGTCYELRWEADPGVAKPCWIGRHLPDAIITAEHEIGASYVDFAFGRYVFRKRN